MPAATHTHDDPTLTDRYDDATMLFHETRQVACVRALVSCPFRDKCRGGGTEAIADLVGHREENVIPIHAFYSGEVRENYFARLVVDRSTPVRRAFYAMVSDWLATLPDRHVLSLCLKLSQLLLQFPSLCV